jgi:hypothetical protein
MHKNKTNRRKRTPPDAGRDQRAKEAPPPAPLMGGGTQRSDPTVLPRAPRRPALRPYRRTDAWPGACGLRLPAWPRLTCRLAASRSPGCRRAAPPWGRQPAAEPLPWRPGLPRSRGVLATEARKGLKTSSALLQSPCGHRSRTGDENPGPLSHELSGWGLATLDLARGNVGKGWEGQ